MLSISKNLANCYSCSKSLNSVRDVGSRDAPGAGAPPVYTVTP